MEGSESDRSHQGEDKVVEDLVTSRNPKCQVQLNPETQEFIIPEPTPSTEDEATGESPMLEMDDIHKTQSPIQAECTESQRAELSRALENSRLLGDQEEYRGLQNALELIRPGFIRLQSFFQC